MLAWSIYLTRQDYGSFRKQFDREAVLATWMVDPSGLDWIDRLIQDGQAVQRRSGGYPSIYTAPARHVVPLFEMGVPPATYGESWDVEINRTSLDRCAPDQVLTIIVGDQS